MSTCWVETKMYSHDLSEFYCWKDPNFEKLQPHSIHINWHYSVLCFEKVSKFLYYINVPLFLVSMHLTSFLHKPFHKLLTLSNLLLSNQEWRTHVGSHSKLLEFFSFSTTTQVRAKQRKLSRFSYFLLDIFTTLEV